MSLEKSERAVREYRRIDKSSLSESNRSIEKKTKVGRVMFVQQLNELITDLSDPETSPFTISRLLTIKTLSRLDVISVVFHEVTASATLKKVSSFGISDPELASWTELALS